MGEPSPDDRQLTVSVRDLHVRFRVYSDHRLTLRQLTARGFRSREATQVHAVRGVNFDIHRGEALGVVGRNGSGKSTLLRAIAGLEHPDAGQVLVRSQPQLLGVGAVLNPALSGYRNAILGALAMGLRRSEIERRMPEVIEFTELGDSMSRPLRTYSSGMRARLTFAVATLQVPDILLIDEALAVGDRGFRRKSLERVREIQQAAGTIVMVTHNLAEIRQTCSRTIWMDNGLLVRDGPTEEVLEAYESDDPDN